MKYQMISDLPQHERGAKCAIIKAGEAPTIDWREAQVGAYYCLCHFLYKDPEPVYSVSTGYMLKVLENSEIQPGIRQIRVAILHFHGGLDGLLLSDCHAESDNVFWPLTPEEVAEFKAKALKTSVPKIQDF